MKTGKNKVYCGEKLSAKEKSGFNIRFVSAYTAIFAVMALALVCWFVHNDYTLIRSGDAFMQHFKALIYFSDYLKEIFSNIFINHSFVIPQWDFEVGLGSDIISTFAYYSLGDPFNFLSVLVPEQYMHYYFQLMIVMRLYCAGLAFALLCFKTGKKSNMAVLVGAITYCFSAYAIYAGLKHPYFVNPMTYLPLIILGVENIIKGKNILLLSFTVALAEFSNFYFFYMIVILTVIYVIVRLLTLYKTDFRQMVVPFVKIMLSSLLGVGMGAILFLPVVFAFLGDMRSSSELSIRLFYGVSYYKKLIRSFITSETPGAWLRPGMSSLFLPAVAALFTQKKKNLHLKLLLVISVVFMSLPIFGVVFNGFSYACNRWCFAFGLVASYIVVTSWNKLLQSGKRETIGFCVLSFAVIAISAIVMNNISLEFVLSAVVVVITVAFLSFLYFSKERIRISSKVKQSVLLVLAVASILVYSFFLFASEGTDYMSEFSKISRYPASYRTNEKMLMEADNEESEFWRYTARDLDTNSSFLSSLKSTQFYWSLSNGNISKFRSEMNLSENTPYFYKGFDARTILNTLSSVKYFLNTDKTNRAVPYGYSKTGTEAVWINDNALPFGYTYDNYVTKEQLGVLKNKIDEEALMLQSAVIENDVDGINKGEAVSYSENLNYEINFRSKHVSRQGNSFVVTKNNAKVDFIFDMVENSETYLSIVNLGYAGTNPYDLYSEDTSVDPYNLFSLDNIKNERKKERIIKQKNTWRENQKLEFKLIGWSGKSEKHHNRFIYYTEKASYYANRKSFDINMGYTKNGMVKITLVFPYVGVYTFDDIMIVASKMDDYEERVAHLKEDVMKNLNFGYNTVNGSIALSEPKLLCMTVPYCRGWTAYVDNNEVELIKVNGIYCGLMIEDGEHEIELRYNTPGFKLGAIISAFSLAIFLVLVYYYHRPKRECGRKFKERRTFNEN